jgi:GTP-binding protein
MPPFKNAKYLLTEVDPAKVPPCRADVAFVGRSNVGKSSLLNALLGLPLAKVSQTPGRTRTINVFQLEKDQWVVDLPGYGFARGPEKERMAWRPMIESYLTGRPSLRCVFMLVDAEVGPTALDIQMKDWLDSQGLPFHPVATKSDKVSPSRHISRKKEVALALGVSPEDLSWVSSSKSLGIQELRNNMLSVLKETSA